jgi:hypothetical protein
MGTRNISWGVKAAGAPSCADCIEILEPQPPGTPRASPGLYWDCLTFYKLYEVINAVFGNDHCVRAENHMKPMLKIHSVGKTQDTLNVTAGVADSCHCAI